MIYDKYGRYYDLIYSGKDYLVECNYIEECIRRFSPIPVRKVLDVGCGTGSHAVILAKRGYQVVGVDLSEVMVKQARVKGAGLPVRFYVQDMRKLNLNQLFDLAICMFGSFSYLVEDEDVKSALCAVRKHLRRNALFIFDFWFPFAWSVKERWKSVLESSGGDLKVIRVMEGVFNALDNTVNLLVRCYVIKGNLLIDKFAEEHRLRTFTIPEISHLLTESGFKPVSFFKVNWSEKPPYTFEKPDVRTTNVVCIAKVY